MPIERLMNSWGVPSALLRNADEIAAKHGKSSLRDMWPEEIQLRIAQALANISGYGLNLHGPCGGGKSSLAAILIREWAPHWKIPNLHEHMQGVTPSKQCLSYYARWIHISDLIAQATNFSEQDCTEFLIDLQSTPILILDDIGSEAPTEFRQEILTTLLKRRLDKSKWTLVTTNLNHTEWAEKNPRISSVLSSYTPIYMDCPDYRCQNIPIVGIPGVPGTHR